VEFIWIEIKMKPNLKNCPIHKLALYRVTRPESAQTMDAVSRSG
jgi:hypothetical protein